MARDYIELSNDGGTTYRRYDVMHSTDPVIPIPETPSESGPTLDGSSVIAFGVSKSTWAFTLRVLVSDARTNYGNLSQLLGLFSATTIAANNIRLRLRDYDVAATTYQTVLRNKTKPDVRALSVDHYATDGVYTVKVELRQI